jgi:hypothetical protein
MKPSEKLMLLLELNGYDVTKFKLKKQLEYEKTGNNDLYKHSKYADLIVSHYQFEEKHDYLHRNPLLYNDSWGTDINSIDQFYFTHPDIYNDMTFEGLVESDSFDKDKKKKIISEVLNQWTDEYKEASTVQMEHLKQLVQLLPKKSKIYKRPGKLSVILLVLVLLFWAFLYRSPEMLMPSFLTMTHTFVTNFNQLLYDYDVFSLAGFITILFTAFYIVFNNAVGMFMRDVSGEKGRHARRTFKKWGKDMAKARTLQKKALNNYVNLAAKGKTKLDLKSITTPERKLEKYKWYVAMVNRRYDWMTKHYKTIMRWLRRTLFLALLMNIGFIVFGTGLLGGWINV